MFHRLSTWFSPGKSRPVDESTTSAEDLAEVRKRVKRLEIQQLELADDFAALFAQHEKLRGRLTGGLRRSQSGAADELSQIPTGNKAALREFARQRGLFRNKE